MGIVITPLRHHSRLFGKDNTIQRRFLEFSTHMHYFFWTRSSIFFEVYSPTSAKASMGKNECALFE